MKRWHMEGIIRVSNTTSQKLIVPDPNRMLIWSPAYSYESRKDKDSWPVVFFRYLASLILRYF